MGKKFYKEDNEPIPAVVYTDTPPSGFTEITSEADLYQLEKKMFKLRETDGQDYYNDLRTSWRMLVLKGYNTQQEEDDIHMLLSGLKLELITGDWIETKGINSSLAVAGMYTQAVKDGIDSKTSAYISENF